MNHLPRYLDTAGLDSLTAYAVGWIDHPPPTPFAVHHTGGKK